MSQVGREATVREAARSRRTDRQFRYSWRKPMSKAAGLLAIYSIDLVGNLFACERQPSEKAKCSVDVDLKGGKVIAIFPVLGAQDSWTWRKPSTKDTYAEYMWRVNLGTCNKLGIFESGEFGFGITLIKFPGDSERSGTLAELLRFAQSDVWRKEIKGNVVSYDNLLQFHARSGVSRGGVLILVNDQKAVELMFREKPPAAYLEAILAEPKQSFTCVTNIRYVQ
jgi:hypothetical protein